MKDIFDPLSKKVLYCNFIKSEKEKELLSRGIVEYR